MKLPQKTVDALVVLVTGAALETVAEKMDCSVSGLQKQEYTALDGCAEAWENLAFVQEILKAAQ